MPEMTNIRGQNLEEPKNNYHCMKCTGKLYMKCMTCDDGSNFMPFKTLQKEGENDGRKI
jgi:hypothetical protein